MKELAKIAAIVIFGLTLLASCSEDDSEDIINPSEQEEQSLLADISAAIIQTCEDQYTITLLTGHDFNDNNILEDSEVQIVGRIAGYLQT